MKFYTIMTRCMIGLLVFAMSISMQSICEEASLTIKQKSNEKVSLLQRCKTLLANVITFSADLKKYQSLSEKDLLAAQKKETEFETSLNSYEHKLKNEITWYARTSGADLFDLGTVHSLSLNDIQEIKKVQAEIKTVLHDIKQKLSKLKSRKEDLESHLSTEAKEERKNLFKKQENFEKEIEKAVKQQIEQSRLKAPKIIELERPESSVTDMINEIDGQITALKVQLMHEAVNERRKDYASMKLPMKFEDYEKMIVKGIEKQIQELEAEKRELE